MLLLPECVNTQVIGGPKVYILNLKGLQKNLSRFSCCSQLLMSYPNGRDKFHYGWNQHLTNIGHFLFNWGNSAINESLFCYRVFFFNWPSPENVSRLAPLNFAWTGPPPNFSKCWYHIHFARYLDVFDHEGGQSGTLTFF